MKTFPVSPYKNICKGSNRETFSAMKLIYGDRTTLNCIPEMAGFYNIHNTSIFKELNLKEKKATHKVRKD